MRQLRGILLIGVLAQGCAFAKPDAETDAFGRRLIHLFETADSSGIAGSLDPSLTTATAWTQISKVHGSLAAFHRDSTTLIGWSIFQSPDTYRADLTYELHGAGWALVTIAVTRRQGALVANGFHYQRSTASLATLNAFTFAGRTWRHYLVLGLAVTCLLVALGSAITLLRTPMPRRWLWALVAVVGVGQVGINWTTGELFWSLVRFQLFCAGYHRPGFVGPWVVSFALPLGAAVALWRRHQFLGGRPSTETPLAAA